MSNRDLSKVAELRGIAVVVDDELDDEHSAIAQFVAELEAAGVPVLARKELPGRDTVVHLRGASVVVLDWDLKPHGLGLGVPLPPSLRDESMRSVAEFTGAVLDGSDGPVFIFSNHPEDAIWPVLVEVIGRPEETLQRRVHVRSKDNMSRGGLAEIESWVLKHPAVYVWKAWKRELDLAIDAVFREFEESDPAWPSLLWSAAELDNSPHHELAQVIGRNVLHRLKPVFFDASVLKAAESGEKRAESLRRVLHRQAVIPSEGLHADSLGPGDFFYDLGSGNCPDKILINVSPACDLVPREGEVLEDKRILVLCAKPVDMSRTLKKNREKLLKEDKATSQVLHLLLPSGRPYEVLFKTWDVVKWGDVKDSRRGRLIEPYITLLQQKFALYIHRQGLPTLPDGFYEDGDGGRLAEP